MAKQGASFKPAEFFAQINHSADDRHGRRLEFCFFDGISNAIKFSRKRFMTTGGAPAHERYWRIAGQPMLHQLVGNATQALNPHKDEFGSRMCCEVGPVNGAFFTLFRALMAGNDCVT